MSQLPAEKKNLLKVFFKEKKHIKMQRKTHVMVCHYQIFTEETDTVCKTANEPNFKKQ